ncbi:hypothetical protein OFAG_01115 [Oxalobacter formigenes HOxBLS]|uniref:Uncharacterized protein n=1 Tax=Oxalobacter paraformigenes TaxID=556268 RepID=C3X426_9BURK|nr:hypothetical protein OFAG_01115 [Oxalobacter paraformigenes]
MNTLFRFLNGENQDGQAQQRLWQNLKNWKNV